MTQELALGIDIGGTNTKFGLVNSQGEILARGNMSTTGHAAPEDFVAALKTQVLSLISSVPEIVISEGKLIGAGIGAPNGNFYTGEIKFAPNMPWQGIIPIAALIQEALGVNATLTNDANAAALGEMMYGAARGMKDFIVVTLGTGLGSGFVANGQLVYGHDGFAGELGHIIAVRNGRKCGCGRLGCLEAYASATGIVRTANEWIAERTDATTLRQNSPITAENIHAAAEQGDQMALELFAFTGRILGELLADAVTITSPEAIIFFGGLANAGELLFSHVRRHMEDNLLNIYKGQVKIMQSSLPGADAAILGASALAWQ